MKKLILIAFATVLAQVAHAENVRVTDNTEIQNIRNACIIAFEALTEMKCKGDTDDRDKMTMFSLVNASQNVYRQSEGQPVLTFEYTMANRRYLIDVTTDETGKKIIGMQRRLFTLGQDQLVNLGTIAKPELKKIFASWELQSTYDCKLEPKISN